MSDETGGAGEVACLRNLWMIRVPKISIVIDGLSSMKLVDPGFSSSSFVFTVRYSLPEIRLPRHSGHSLRESGKWQRVYCRHSSMALSFLLVPSQHRAFALYDRNQGTAFVLYDRNHGKLDFTVLQIL